jgi:hypothetical protein
MICIKIKNEKHLMIVLNFFEKYFETNQNNLKHISDRTKNFEHFKLCHQHVMLKTNTNKDIYLLVDNKTNIFGPDIQISLSTDVDTSKVDEINISFESLRKEPNVIIGYLKLINF